MFNTSYDGYNERFGYGAGIQAGLEAGSGVVSGFDIVAKYYPVVSRRQRIAGPRDAFVIGLQLRSYGHLFGFMVGNSSAIGITRLMQGAQFNDVYFGFNIKRLI